MWKVYCKVLKIHRVYLYMITEVKVKKKLPKPKGIVSKFDNNTLCLVHSIIWNTCLYACGSPHAHSTCISITQKYYIMSVSTNLAWLGWPCLFHLTGRQWHQSNFCHSCCFSQCQWESWQVSLKWDSKNIEILVLAR